MRCVGPPDANADPDGNGIGSPDGVRPVGAEDEPGVLCRRKRFPSELQRVLPGIPACALNTGAATGCEAVAG